jgi:hypothetical protein
MRTIESNGTAIKGKIDLALRPLPPKENLDDMK